MESRYSSEITNARIPSSLNSISIAAELKSRDYGDPSTRNTRAVTRTVNNILKLTKDLPPYERADTCLHQCPRMAIHNVEFVKTAQLTFLADEIQLLKNQTFLF